MVASDSFHIDGRFIIKVAHQLNARPLKLATAALPPVGTKVFAIGNPLGFANTMSDGLISGIREIDHVEMIQISAPISPGSSGGPLLADNGKVVGVTTSGIKGGQNLNFAIPASRVADLLLRREGLEKVTALPLIRKANHKRTSGSDLLKSIGFSQRSDEYVKQGDYGKAIQSQEEALRLNPNNPFNYSSLAWMLATLPDGRFRDGERAVELATEACRNDTVAKT